MGAEQSIENGEDVLTKIDAGKIDLSETCKKDIICPPKKYVELFDNDNNNDNRNLIIIIFILLLYACCIYIYYKYI